MSLIAYPNALKYRKQATDPWSTATIFAKADLESLADKFDTTETYTEGEIVLYQGGMYKCKAGGAGPGAWDATEWDQTTVEAELAALQTEIDSTRNTLNQKAAKVDLTDINQTSPNCTVTNGIAKGTYFYLDGVLTRATAAISENAPFTSSNCETVTAGGLNDLNENSKRVQIYNSNGVILEKSGNVVILRSKANNAESAGIRSLTIPAEYRPMLNASVPYAYYNGTTWVNNGQQISVGTNGTVVLTNLSGGVDTTTQFTFSSFCLSWII